MGAPFLHVTHTLTTNAYRLRERLLPLQVPRCLSIGPLTASELVMQVYLDSHLILAFPDTGSEMDLISADCARKYGFQVQELDHTENDRIEVANGRIERLSGKVQVNFNVFRPEPTIRDRLQGIKKEPETSENNVLTSAQYHQEASMKRKYECLEEGFQSDGRQIFYVLVLWTVLPRLSSWGPRGPWMGRILRYHVWGRCTILVEGASI